MSFIRHRRVRCTLLEWFIVHKEALTEDDRMKLNKEILTGLPLQYEILRAKIKVRKWCWICVIYRVITLHGSWVERAPTRAQHVPIIRTGNPRWKKNHHRIKYGTVIIGCKIYTSVHDICIRYTEISRVYAQLGYVLALLFIIVLTFNPFVFFARLLRRCCLRLDVLDPSIIHWSKENGCNWCHTTPVYQS